MAETKIKKEETKVEEQIENTPIDGQMEIAPEDTAELKVVEETADTLVAEMPDGEIVEIDKEEIANCRKQIGIDPDTKINTRVKTENGSNVWVDINDYILKSNVIDIVNNVVEKYNGKVILSMSEVRDIIKAITTAVNE